MSKIEDDNGYWLSKDCNISKVGVFPYLGRDISPNLEPEKIYYVYRPAEELFSQETIDSFNEAVPLVDEHEMLGTGFTPAEQKGVEGVVLRLYPSDDRKYLKGDVKIFSDKMKSLLKRGKKELSMGYFCEYELQDGDYNGQHFDAIQRNLRANHVALVDRGRSGSDVRVLDRALVFDKMELNKMVKTHDEDVDKRKDISEVEAMLYEAKKDPSKLTDELIRTIAGKMEQVSYNKSETGKADDSCGKDEDEEFAEGVKYGEELEKDPSERKKLDREHEREGEEEAEDEEEPEKEDSKKAMDSMSKELIRLKKALDSFPVKMEAEIAKKQEFAKRLSKKIGTFDSTGKTIEEMAVYACDKLGIEVEKKEAVATINGYLRACRDEDVYSIASDSSISKKSSSIKEYLEGK